VTDLEIRELVEELFAALDTGGDDDLRTVLERLDRWLTEPKSKPELEEVA
jgi:hypothetical protein